MCQNATITIFDAMDMMDVLENGAEYFLPNLSIDLVIIGYEENTLKCLLLKLGEKWALPGGYVGKTQSVDESVKRVMLERAGLVKPHLKFLSVFGAADRQFDQEFKSYFDLKGMTWKDDYFINNRFVTLAYYSLVDIHQLHPTPGPFDEAAEWFSFDELPPMWLDHRLIVDTARAKLKLDVKTEPVTYNLLSDAFTMPQLHQLHQTILETDIDRSRFQKKMLASGLFERLPQLKKEAPGRNPYQYRLKDKV